MRVTKLVMIAGALLATVVMALNSQSDKEVTVGVRGAFFRGKAYPARSHQLEVLLESGDKSQSHTIEIVPFSQLVFGEPFALPVKDEMNIIVRDNGDTLVEIGVKKQEQGVDVSHGCTVLPDLSPSYPRRSFPTYIPPHLLTLACPMPIGLLEMQITCKHGETSCW